MGREDYAHWNEEADLVWWLEEGRHPYEPDDYAEYDEPHDDWDWDDDEDDSGQYSDGGADGHWQAEDAGWENALFGDA